MGITCLPRAITVLTTNWDAHPSIYEYSEFESGNALGVGANKHTTQIPDKHGELGNQIYTYISIYLYMIIHVLYTYNNMLASDSERTEITNPLRNETSRAKTRNYGKSAEISCLITYKPSHMDGHTLLNRSCNV